MFTLIYFQIAEDDNSILLTCFSTDCDPWNNFNKSPLADSKAKQECAQRGPNFRTTSGKCSRLCTLIVIRRPSIQDNNQLILVMKKLMFAYHTGVKT